MVFIYSSFFSYISRDTRHDAYTNACSTCAIKNATCSNYAWVTYECRWTLHLYMRDMCTRHGKLTILHARSAAIPLANMAGCTKRSRCLTSDTNMRFCCSDLIAVFTRRGVNSDKAYFGWMHSLCCDNAPAGSFNTQHAYAIAFCMYLNFKH